MKDDLSLALLLVELPATLIMETTGLSRSAVFKMKQKARDRVHEWSTMSPRMVHDRSTALDGIPLSLVNTPSVPSGHLPQGETKQPPQKKSRPKPAAPKRAKWTTVPDDWKPNQKHFDKAKELGVDFKKQLEKFRLHEFREPKSDADRAFARWLNNAKEFEESVPPGAKAHREHQIEERPRAPYHRPFQD